MNDSKKFDGFDRPDETPKTFAELKPPGYWSKTLGYFVPVREMTAEDIEEAKNGVWKFGDSSRTAWRNRERAVPIKIRPAAALRLGTS